MFVHHFNWNLFGIQWYWICSLLIIKLFISMWTVKTHLKKTQTSKVKCPHPPSDAPYTYLFWFLDVFRFLTLHLISGNDCSFIFISFHFCETLFWFLKCIVSVLFVFAFLLLSLVFLHWVIYWCDLDIRGTVVKSDHKIHSKLQHLLFDSSIKTLFVLPVRVTWQHIVCSDPTQFKPPPLCSQLHS